MLAWITFLNTADNTDTHGRLTATHIMTDSNPGSVG